MTLVPWRGPLLVLGARLLGAGLAGPWALGVLVIVGHVAAGVSGPCGVAALLIAATAAILAALCHAEVSRRRHASMYESTRDVLGVRAALVLGWASAAWRVSALAACGRGLGATMDYISGGRVRSTVNAWLTRILPFQPGIALDPLAAGATAITAILFILGLERSRALRLLLNASISLAVLFFVLVGATHCEADMWSTHAFLPAGTSGLVTGAALISAGFLGVTTVRAESARSWAHGSPSSTSRRGNRTSGPSRHLELAACVIVILVASLSYLAVTVVLTMMVNFRTLGSDAPTLVQAFEVRDVDWARLVMSTLGISALSIALVELAQPLHKLIRALAADGMLPRDLARDWAITGTPAAAISICGLCASLLALLVPLSSLLHLTAAGALLINAVISANSVLLRFQPDPEYASNSSPETCTHDAASRSTVQDLRDRLGAIPAVVRRAGEACRWKPEQPPHDEEESEPLMTIEENTPDEEQQQEQCRSQRRGGDSSSELSGYETDSSTNSTDIDAVVAEFKEKIKVATLSDYAPRCARPDAVTARRASLALAGALVTGTIACATTLMVLELGASFVALLLLGTVTLSTAALLGVAARQPQVSQRPREHVVPQSRHAEDTFRVPLAPWLPACAVLLHITLLLQLLYSAWLPILITTLTGLAAFATREWRLARRRGVAFRRRGERIHLHAPPLHPMVPTLVPSHQRLPKHSQRRLTQVDTILISR